MPVHIQTDNHLLTKSLVWVSCDLIL